MYYDSKDMLRQTVIPVLLGDCARAHLFSLKIYFRCGIVSYMCDDKRRAADFINPTTKFFPLYSKKDTRVICDILDYLASVKDYLPIIIPCNEYYREFVRENREFLESRFILSDTESFFKQKPMSVF
ncbi:MAG: hypothetical protein IJV72_08735 [Clostridia bacterium]|nr:hypothetical protein [Clostridia bacterium]